MSADFERLTKAEHEVTLLKRLFVDKLISYSGITYDELKNICIMLGIIEPKEEKTVE